MDIDKMIDAVADGNVTAKVLHENAVYTYYYVDYDDPPPTKMPPYSYRQTTEAKWMQKVAKTMKKGALTKQAAAQGETPAQFCATKHTGKAAKRCGLRKAFMKSNHESYDEYLSRYESKSKSGATVGPLLSSQDHALAVRVLTRLSETHRDPVRVRGLRERLLLPEQQVTGA